MRPSVNRETSLPFVLFTRPGCDACADAREQLDGSWMAGLYEEASVTRLCRGTVLVWWRQNAGNPTPYPEEQIPGVPALLDLSTAALYVGPDAIAARLIASPPASTSRRDTLSA